MPSRTALLIANDAYDDADLARLNAPWEDVVSLRRALADVGDFEIMPPLYNAEIGDIQTAVTALFRRADSGDTVLLYYTGHGVRDPDGDLHFALKRTQVDLLPANALSASFVRDAMRRSQAGAQVVILDCCHSGGFIVEGAKRQRTLAPLQSSDLLDSRAGGVAADGKYILTASEPNQSAYEAGERSVFTRYLVDGLVNGAAAPEKPYISIEDLHDYLYRTLRSEGVPQQPMKMFASSAPNMIIGRNPRPRVPIPQDLVAALFSGDRRTARGAFEELKEIAEGPDEHRASDARILLQQRLDQTEDLLVSVADPIRQYLRPAQQSEAPQAEPVRAVVQHPLQNLAELEREAILEERQQWLDKERTLIEKIESLEKLKYEKILKINQYDYRSILYYSTFFIFISFFSTIVWIFGPGLAISDSRPLETVSSRFIFLSIIWVLFIFFGTVALSRRSLKRARYAEHEPEYRSDVTQVFDRQVATAPKYAGSIKEPRRWLRLKFSLDIRVAALGVLVLSGVGWCWWLAEQHVADEMDYLTYALTDYEADLLLLQEETEDRANLALLPRPLNRLRAAAGELASSAEDVPAIFEWFAETSRPLKEAEAAYHRALTRLLLPNLLGGLEKRIAPSNRPLRPVVLVREGEEALPEPKKKDDIRESDLGVLDSPVLTYDVLKAYLMLGGRGPMDEAYMQSFMALDWEASYPAREYPDLRADLDSHLDALLKLDPPPELVLNEGAINIARNVANKISVAERAYRILKSHPDVLKLRPWRVSDAAGHADLVFLRASGRDLDEPIPGLFTYAGFWSRFLPSTDVIVAAAVEELWVLEPDPDYNVLRHEMVDEIRKTIRKLYYEEYIRTWSDLMADLRIVPFSDAEQAAEVLNLLAGSNSPLKRLLLAIVDNTELVKKPAKDSEIVQEAGQVAFHRFSSRFRNAARLLEAAGRSEPVVEGQWVQEHFGDLRQFVGVDGDFALIMDQIDQLFEVVDDVASGRGGALSVLSETQPAVRLSRLAQRAPPGVREMLDLMLSQANVATVGGIRAQLNEIWRSTVAPVCHKRLHGRYPFGSGPEMALDDLAYLLGPSGLIDNFYKGRLKSMVDDNVSPWRWRGSIGASLGFSNDDLEFFESAAKIRDAFFPKDRSTPHMAFEVSVYDWDPKITLARLRLGGLLATFSEDDRIGGGRYLMEWPGLLPSEGAELSVETKVATTPTTQRVTEAGVWGLFKLVDQSEVTKGPALGLVRVPVNVSAGEFFMQIATRRLINPFEMHEELSSFRCPEGL